MAEREPLPESRDVSVRGLLIFAGGFVAFLAAALAVLGLLFDTGAPWPAPGPAHEENMASPALQRAPQADLATHRRREADELSRLGWVDREAGIARIPVEEAMRLVAERGLPDWQAALEDLGPECRLLVRTVPRSPQAARCRETGEAGLPPETAP